MRRFLFVILLTVSFLFGCSDTPDKKAVKLLQSENVSVSSDIKLDSVLDYPESFEKKIEAIKFSRMAHEKTDESVKYIGSLSDNERNNDDFINYCTRTKEEVIALLNKSKDSDIKAAGIIFKGNIKGIPTEFVGWSYTLKNDTTENVYYFDQNVTRILEIEKK